MFNNLIGNVLGGMLPNLSDFGGGQQQQQSPFSPSPFSQGMQSSLGGPGSTFMGQDLQGGLRGLIDKNIAGEQKAWDAANSAQTPTPSGGGGMWGSGFFNNLQNAMTG